MCDYLSKTIKTPVGRLTLAGQSGQQTIASDASNSDNGKQHKRGHSEGPPGLDPKARPHCPRLDSGHQIVGKSKAAIG